MAGGARPPLQLGSVSSNVMIQGGHQRCVVEEADKLVFSVPMSTGRRRRAMPAACSDAAAVVYASSVGYDSGGAMDGFDHQRPSIAHWLRIIDCIDIAEIVAPTAAAPDALRAVRDTAIEQAREAARLF